MKRAIAIAVCVTGLGACAPHHGGAPNADHGFQTAGIGLGHLVLSPFLIAANSILNDKRSEDYWDVERRWMVGQYREIAAHRWAALRQRMGLG